MLGIIVTMPGSVDRSFSHHYPCTLYPYSGMLKAAQHLPRVREMLDQATQLLGWDLLDVCLNGTMMYDDDLSSVVMIPFAS